MDNPEFLIAGYALTWTVLVWYAYRTNRSVRRGRRLIESMGETEAGGHTPADPDTERDTA